MSFNFKEYYAKNKEKYAKANKKWYNKNYIKNNLITITCDYCGNKKETIHKHTKYCSKRCSNIANKLFRTKELFRLNDFDKEFIRRNKKVSEV